jgi:hypothetical protein
LKWLLPFKAAILSRHRCAGASNADQHPSPRRASSMPPMFCRPLPWAPAHVFPGVLLGMAINLAGVGAWLRVIMIVAGLTAVLAGGWGIRSYLNRHPLPARLPDLAV